MTAFQQARLTKDFKNIIASDGNEVGLDDPRVVHIWPISTSVNTSRLIGSAFERRGWNFRYTGGISQKGLDYAGKLCSGRECLSCLSMVGETVKDMEENREKDEISVYYNFDLPGPCQSGAWPLVWDTFAQRLEEKDTVFMASTNMDNNYMGQGEVFASELVTSIVIGDILEEAEGTLKCIAKDRKSAMETFERETGKLIERYKEGLKAIGPALEKWAASMAKIPLATKVEDTPRVLILGGMAVIFIHHQITEYFLDQGIIPKIEELSLGVNFVEGRRAVRYGMKRGLAHPKDQFKFLPMMLSMFNPKNDTKEALTALKARAHITGIDFSIKRFRKIADKSGLLYYNPPSFPDVLHEGHKLVSYTTDTETPLIAGLYACSVKSEDIDGIVNASYFTCLPSLNAQAINKALSVENDIPYAAIDCDGPSISVNQRRMFEAVAVQARRVREKKVGG